MAREYFPAYHSYLEVMEELTDAEKGRLFTACLLYSKTGEAPQLSGNERFVFPAFRSQIDRDNAEYAQKCATNRKNGELGWKRTGGERPPNAPQGKGEGKGKGKEEGKGKGEGNTPPNPLKGDYEAAFSAFWAAYPRKVGKGDARKAFAKVRVDLGTLLSAIEAQKNSEQWQREGGRYIPNPATWLNQGRWEDDLSPAPGGGSTTPGGGSAPVSFASLAQQMEDEQR